VSALAPIAARLARHDLDAVPGGPFRCPRTGARSGEAKPTPLLLRYKAGGDNCLQQDLYRRVAFPLQMAWALRQGGVDVAGGESVQVE
jgi:hypothetical protein